MRKVKIGVAWIGRSVLLAMAKARFTKITNRPDIYKYIHFVGHINNGGTGRPLIPQGQLRMLLRHIILLVICMRKGTALPTSSGSIMVVPCEADRLGIVGVA